MKLINGKEISKNIKDQVKEEVASLIAQGRRVPKLAVVLVGNNQASKVYVRNKERGCAQAHPLSYYASFLYFPSYLFHLPSDLSPLHS